MKKRPVPIHPTIVFIVLVLLVAPSAFLQGKNLPMWLFGVMMVTLVVTFVWSKLVLRSIRVRRIIREPAKVGEPYVVRYEVTNRAMFMTGFSLWIEEKQSPTSTWQHFFRKARGWIMEVGAGETVHGEAIFWPMKRGEALFDHIRISTRFPFGMVKSSITIRQELRLFVQPEVVALRPSVVRAIVSSGPLGQRSQRRGRGGDDYFGLRELLSGDRLGDIAWKASAHRDELVCIHRSRPSLPKIRVVIDVTTPTTELQCDDDPRELEEKAISLCASLLTEATRQDQEVALTVLGIKTHGESGFHTGPRHLSRLLSTLSRIDLDLDRNPIPLRPTSAFQHVGLAVVRPDRSHPMKSVQDAWYFTASQCAELQLPLARSGTA